MKRFIAAAPAAGRLGSGDDRIDCAVGRAPRFMSLDAEEAEPWNCSANLKEI